VGVAYDSILFVKDITSKFASATPNPEGDRAARVAGRRLIETQIEVARRLQDMNEGYAFAALGCSSIGHYGMTLGLSQQQARMLADAGRAFAIAPGLEEEVRVGAVTIEAAAALARILEDPRFAAESAKWRKLALETTPPALLRAIRKAIAEADAEQAVEEVTLLLKPEVRDKMGRAREIISSMHGVSGPVTNEVVVEFTIDYFLAHEDPDLVKPGTRRKGATVNDPSRAIPAKVKRSIIKKRGRKCQVHGCSHHLYLNFCHIDPHAEGGSREEGNLFIGCWLHHWLYDHGWITLSGTAENPVFRNLQGDLVGRPRPPP
jgi:hypothetical protein